LLASAAAAVTAALAAHAFLIEPTRLEVTHHDLPVPRLPAVWEGARLIHLTDLHYGDPRSASLFRRMVRVVNDLAPDLIAITGDFVLNRASQVKKAVEHLRCLEARHGMVGVLGDHDFPSRRRQPRAGVVPALEAAGVRILRNAALDLPGGLRLAGVDPNTRRCPFGDLDAALRPLGDALPHLLLAHSPDILDAAARRGVRVVLCGHTHGGQVVVPFYGPPITHTRVGRRHASGWSSRGTTRMYTCRGLASHYSLRFLCRPEIAVFRLTRGAP
jgi:hypothetical protein